METYEILKKEYSGKLQKYSKYIPPEKYYKIISLCMLCGMSKEEIDIWLDAEYDSREIEDIISTHSQQLTLEEWVKANYSKDSEITEEMERKYNLEYVEYGE
ncbi:MAG: hypothetical protein PHW96_00615 [Candidatus Nanoarchaeia archaeon]|nr:hypothetical protein [Candidatus Nanoarchaeia archaeon]